MEDELVQLKKEKDNKLVSTTLPKHVGRYNDYGVGLSK